MQVYCVLCKGDCETVVDGIFTDRKKAEIYLLNNASQALEEELIPQNNRNCVYSNNGELTEIYDDFHYDVDYWIYETDLID